MLQKNWTELIKPKGLKIDPGEHPTREATIVVQPLERGFGLTLGNALRRILLSSLQGAAVTSIQIDGVLHEFSSIPGVNEDVTDIVLNVKSLALRMHGDGPKRMTLKADGPKVVTAGMIETGHDIEIMNPDQVPFVYLERRATSESDPSMPLKTSSKSERSGGSMEAKFASAVMSFNA